MIALLFAHLGLVSLVAGIRFGGHLDALFPFAIDTARWATATGVLLGLAGLLLRREGARGLWPWSSWPRMAAWWALVCVPAGVWAVGDDVVEFGSDTLLLGSAVVFGFAVVARRNESRRRPFWWGDDARAITAVLLLTGFVLALVFLAADVDVDSVVPWATYPAYALVQLVLALVLPAIVAERDGESTVVTVFALAALFASIHAPNPVVMGLTGGGMLVWALAWRWRTGLVPLCLSMGLLGATFTQSLPEEAADHMRVGPGYVLKRIEAKRIEAYDARVDRLASGGFDPAAEDPVGKWLEFIHLEAFEAPITVATREAWRCEITAATRAYFLRVILSSKEFVRVHATGRGLEGLEQGFLYPEFEPWHPAHEPYAELVSRARERCATESQVEFLAAAYAAFLPRTPGDEELQGYPPWPGALDWRVEVVRRVLRAAGIEDPAEWRRPAREVPWPEPRGGVPAGR